MMPTYYKDMLGWTVTGAGCKGADETGVYILMHQFPVFAVRCLGRTM